MQEEKGTTEDEMAGWHHWLNGHEFEQAPGDGEGQAGFACFSPWGHKESNTTERLNNKHFFIILPLNTHFNSQLFEVSCMNHSILPHNISVCISSEQVVSYIATVQLVNSGNLTLVKYFNVIYIQSIFQLVSVSLPSIVPIMSFL